MAARWAVSLHSSLRAAFERHCHSARAATDQSGAGALDGVGQEKASSPPRRMLSTDPPRRGSPRLLALSAAQPLPPGPTARVRRAREPLRLGSLRSLSDLYVSRPRAGELVLPPGLPTGPWPDRDAATLEIKPFCSNVKTGGGGFGVVWARLEPGNSAHGPQSVLKCHKHVKEKGACPWNLKFEQVDQGWVIYSSSLEHNHALAQSVAEANVHRSMRDIPADLLQIAKNMVSSGIRCADADRFLRHQMKILGEEPTWTYQDVYHATGASTRERAMDASGFSELLFKREHEQGLFHRKKTDAEGCLSHVFFVMPGAEEMYAADLENNVVLLDTKVLPLQFSTSRMGHVLTLSLSHCLAARHERRRNEDGRLCDGGPQGRHESACVLLSSG